MLIVDILIEKARLCRSRYQEADLCFVFQHQSGGIPEDHSASVIRAAVSSSVQSTLSSVPTSVMSTTIEEEGSDVTEGSHVTGNTFNAN